MEMPRVVRRERRRKGVSAVPEDCVIGGDKKPGRVLPCSARKTLENAAPGVSAPPLPNESGGNFIIFICVMLVPSC